MEKGEQERALMMLSHMWNQLEILFWFLPQALYVSLIPLKKPGQTSTAATVSRRQKTCQKRAVVCGLAAPLASVKRCLRILLTVSFHVL